MTETTLIQALAAAQAEMQNAAFDSKSNFSKNGKNNYASLTAMREATVPILAKHGITVTQGVRYTENGMVMRTTLRKQTNDGPSMDGQDVICEDVPMVVGKNDMHGIGSAMTYCRRYGLGAICGIASDEDDDGNEAVKHPPSRESVTKNQAQEIEDEIERLDADRHKFMNHFRVGDISELTTAQYLKAKNMLAERERRAMAEDAAEAAALNAAEAAMEAAE